MPRLIVPGAYVEMLTGDVVDVRVYDDVEALLGVVVLGNICGSKLLRHVELCIVYIRRECKKCGREGEDIILLNSPHFTFSPESRI
jgi:hypothetical protein